MEKTIQQRLSIGPEAMNKLFKSIPMTKHHLNDKPNDYSMQVASYPQINGFIITLHGFFEETAKPEIDINGKPKSSGQNRSRRFNHGHSSVPNRLSKKSFDRTWVIVPMNNSVVVASDMLTIRPYCSNAWSLPQPPVAPAVAPTGAPLANPPAGPASMTPSQVPQPGQIPLAPTLQLPPDVQARLNPVQLELLNRLHLQTKLNAEYTFMLAEQSGWNYDVALKAFQSSVTNLPREAFIPVSYTHLDVYKRQR